MRTATLALSLFALASLTACNQSTIDALEKDKAELQDRLTYKDKVLGESMKEVESLKTQLRDQEAASKTELTQVCDRFESEAKWALTPSGVTMTAGADPVISQCSDNLALSVRKVTKEGVYLKYTVGEETRYSDELIWKGKKRDRNALFIEDGMDHQVMVYVPSCHKDKCDVECLSLRTEHLTCTNPDITP